MIIHPSPLAVAVVSLMVNNDSAKPMRFNQCVSNKRCVADLLRHATGCLSGQDDASVSIHTLLSSVHMQMRRYPSDGQGEPAPMTWASDPTPAIAATATGETARCMPAGQPSVQERRRHHHVKARAEMRNQPPQTRRDKRQLMSTPIEIGNSSARPWGNP